LQKKWRSTGGGRRLDGRGNHAPSSFILILRIALDLDAGLMSFAEYADLKKALFQKSLADRIDEAARTRRG
jgi:hypothetical protein